MGKVPCRTAVLLTAIALSCFVYSSMALIANHFRGSLRTMCRRSYYSLQDLPSETLFLVDGTSLLYQSFYSSSAKNKTAHFTEEYSQQLCQSLAQINRPVELGPSGVLDSTGIGIMAMNFARFVAAVRPKYLACVFDASSKTFRSELFPSYKQQRAPNPPELLPQLVAAPRVLQMFGAQCFSKHGFEADDVMASLGRWALERGLHVVHVSSDKDMLQLVSSRTHVLNLRTLRLLNENDVIAKHGVPPSQLVDMLAIMGDTVDNIPGIYGVGQATAKTLLQKCGDIDAILDAVRLPALPSHLSALSVKNADDRLVLLKALQDTMGADSFAQVHAVVDGILRSAKSSTSAAASTNAKSRKANSDSTFTASSKANRFLVSLFACGAEQLKLFRTLVRLREDVDLSVLDHYEVAENMGDRPVRVREDFFLQNSAALRYVGEPRGDVDGVERRLLNISPSLAMPLRVLREQYHLLDRHS